MTKYAFQHEKEYYYDLRISKFGITTKRGGWDCLRHYEIAANNAIVCFRNLNEKHDSCAPHGLKVGYNCIDYSNYAELMQKINSGLENVSKPSQNTSNQLPNNKVNGTIEKAATVNNLLSKIKPKIDETITLDNDTYSSVTITDTNLSEQGKLEIKANTRSITNKRKNNKITRTIIEE
jgi:hypothetical protein